MKKHLLRILGLVMVMAALLFAPNGSKALASKTCTSNSDCPAGTLCCYPCGIPGCQNMCIAPLHGHCPFFP
ncbi:MAG: hypothetical protein M3O15_03585 [Acidobacteriota bacterium]|nr:hypothetical protein [Acidobacteriota bacterium]